MHTTGHAVRGHVEHPAHSVPQKYREPILYLAERMAGLDRRDPPAPERMVDRLAEAMGVHHIRRQPWYRNLDEKRACALLELESARKAALVVLSLVMKADTTRGENARAFFTKVRVLLGAEPIAVPSDTDEHRLLAERYLGI